MKGTILFSTQNSASLNIMHHLESDWKWKKHSPTYYDFSACAKEDCCSSVQAHGFDKSIIDIVPEKNMEAGYFMYASTHKSAAGLPAFTTHLPGNWAGADMGGAPRTLNMAYAGKLRQILQLLSESAKKHKLEWPVTLEVDHHGPTPEGGARSLIFVEIGSSPEQWENETAGAVVSEVMMKALVRPVPQTNAWVGIGGPHYAPNFTKRMLETEGGMAVGHIVPKHHCEKFDAAMLRQAVDKTVEKVEGALLDWKGIPSSERERIVGLIEEAGMKWKKI